MKNSFFSLFLKKVQQAYVQCKSFQNILHIFNSYLEYSIKNNWNHLKQLRTSIPLHKGPQNSHKATYKGQFHNGGLWFGEMEWDCINAHSAACFLKKGLFDQSNAYRGCMFVSEGWQLLQTSRRILLNAEVARTKLTLFGVSNVFSIQCFLSHPLMLRLNVELCWLGSLYLHFHIAYACKLI